MDPNELETKLLDTNLQELENTCLEYIEFYFSFNKKYIDKIIKHLKSQSPYQLKNPTHFRDGLNEETYKRLLHVSSQAGRRIKNTNPSTIKKLTENPEMVSMMAEIIISMLKEVNPAWKMLGNLGDDIVAKTTKMVSPITSETITRLIKHPPTKDFWADLMKNQVILFANLNLADNQTIMQDQNFRHGVLSFCKYLSIDEKFKAEIIRIVKDAFSHLSQDKTKTLRQLIG